MGLVERHVIKLGHQFSKEIDNLAWRSKNLYNYANYLVRQPKAIAMTVRIKIFCIIVSLKIQSQQASSPPVTCHLSPVPYDQTISFAK